MSAAPVAQAAQQIVLIDDQSQVVTLAEPPSTVVVGNPAVADVTTDGKMLFFHPRGFGQTNVIVLDAEGKKLGEYLVSIVYEDSFSVSMYAPGGRETYSCRKDCEPTMRIGDAGTYFTGYNSQAGDKNKLAADQAMGEDATATGQQNSSIVIGSPR